MMHDPLCQRGHGRLALSATGIETWYEAPVICCVCAALAWRQGDFWCQVAIAALLARAHRFDAGEHGESSPAEFYDWFVSDVHEDRE